MQFVGGLVRSRNERSAPVKYEGGSRASHLQLCQEMSKASVFDYHRKDTLTLLVDIDRSSKRDRRTCPDWMVNDLEPLGSIRAHAGFEPCLVAYAKIRWLESTSLEFDVTGHHFIFVKAALAGMVGQRDFHHLWVTIAKLVGGKE